jgi:hypothetical protein
MKAVLTHFVILLNLLSVAEAGKIYPENSGVSPSGTYALGRKAGPASDFVLRRTKPQTVELQNFKLEGGEIRWPYYETIWSKDERYFVVIWSIRKQSDIEIYRIDGDKVTQIKLPNLEKLMIAKERENAAKRKLELGQPIYLYVEHVRFADGKTITCDFSSEWATDATHDNVAYLHTFKIRIKGDEASIVSYELK